MAALADIPDLVGRISAGLAAAGIRHAVTGATAMAAHGYVRATRNLDILVLAGSLDLPRVFEIVRRQGFEGEDRELIEAIRDRYVAVLRSGSVTVEILLPVLSYHHRLLDRAVSREVAGTPVPFVTLEDLIVLKMLWRRAKDMADLHALLATAGSLDASYVRETLREILPEDDPRHFEMRDLIRRYASPST